MSPSAFSISGARRRLVLAAGALAATTNVVLWLGTVPAHAVPVTPAVTPLGIYAPELPASCPIPSDVDGTALTRELIKSSRENRRSSLGVEHLSSVFPQAVLTVCDPQVAAARGVIGAITGETSIPAIGDVVAPGARAVRSEGNDIATSAAMAGDRFVLPLLGPGSVLDLTVRTVGGARTIRLGPLGEPRAIAVSVEGSVTAPVAVVEREGAEPTRTAVAPVSAVAIRLRHRFRGRTLLISGSAAPGTAVDATTSGDRYVAASAVSDARHRLATLKLGPLAKDDRKVTITALNFQRRTVTVLQCRVRWNKARRAPDRVRCETDPTGASATTTPVDGTPARRASQVQRPRPAKRTHLNAQRLRTRAVTAAALPTVPATTTAMWTTSDGYGHAGLAAGDLNGDGRPDGTVLTNRGAAEFLLSSPASWSRVGVSPAKPDDGTLPVTLPDLTGDGRGELLGAGDTIVTDAFASPARPTTIDLSARRPASASDLNLNVPYGAEGPFGTGGPKPVADVTADGRPEIVIEGTFGAQTYASQDLGPRSRPTFTELFPLATQAYHALENAPGTPGAGETYAQNGPSWQPHPAELNRPTAVTGAGVAVFEPVDLRASPLTPRQLDLRILDARGAVLTTRRFTAAGIPRLVDFDTESGDALISLDNPRGGVCTDERPKLPARCDDGLVRVGADGMILQTVTIPRSGRYLFGAFVPDGPDADTALDVVLWFFEFALSDPTNEVPSVAGEAGTLPLLASSQQGQVALPALPVLADGGAPMQTQYAYSVVLPNGSRWLAAELQPPDDPYATRPATVDHSLSLIAQAPAPASAK